jgi:co-chaperonin GroES (HSP10)
MKVRPLHDRMLGKREDDSGEVKIDGEDYLILREEDVLAILE